MCKKRWQYNRKCYPFLWLIVFISSFIAIISLNILLAYAKYPQPQAILCLGGGMDRLVLSTNIASQNPNLMIWVSSGGNNRKVIQLFHDMGIPDNKYFLDYYATDTVTDFTYLVDDFKQHHIKHLYLITSDFHMPRARAIGTIILGSRGIVFTPMEVRTKSDREPQVKIVRDIVRSIIWLFSGYTGADLKDI